MPTPQPGIPPAPIGYHQAPDTIGQVGDAHDGLETRGARDPDDVSHVNGTGNSTHLKPTPDQADMNPRRIASILRSAGRATSRPRLHFIHIGKTGGRTIITRIEQVGDRARSTIPFDIMCTHGHDFTLADVPAGDKCFFFIRDPISRYVSGFNSRLRGGRPELDYPQSYAERRAFARFPTASLLAEALSSDDVEERRAAEDAFRAIQHLRRDYAHYLIDVDTIRSRRDDILFIGRQEQFEHSWTEFCRRVEIDDRTRPREQRLHATPDGFERRLSQLAVANLQVRLRRDYELCDSLVDHCRRAFLDGS